MGTTFYYDLKYVNNITLMGDIEIIYKTIFKTVKRNDIGERA